MLNELGELIRTMLTTLFIICCIAVPLALWKFIEIIIWLIKNINISIGN